MSYSNKQLIRMDFPLFDFGGGAAEVMSFKIPKDEYGNDQKAKLVNFGIAVVEVFLTGTKEGTFKIGTAGDNDAYGQLNIPTASADEAVVDVAVDTDAILSARIPSGQLVEVNFDFGTDGGSVTGQGIPFIDMWVWQ